MSIDLNVNYDGVSKRHILDGRHLPSAPLDLSGDLFYSISYFYIWMEFVPLDTDTECVTGRLLTVDLADHLHGLALGIIRLPSC